MIVTRDKAGPPVKWVPYLGCPLGPQPFGTSVPFLFLITWFLLLPLNDPVLCLQRTNTLYSLVLAHQPDYLFHVNGRRYASPRPAKPVASASPTNLLEMQILGPHLLNQELGGWDPVISAVRSPSGDSRAPSGVRTGLLLGPASTLGAWLWEVSTAELFRTPS